MRTNLVEHSDRTQIGVSDVSRDEPKSDIDLLFIIGAGPKARDQRIVSNRVGVSAKERLLECVAPYRDFSHAESKIWPEVCHVFWMLPEKSIQSTSGVAPR